MQCDDPDYPFDVAGLKILSPRGMVKVRTKAVFAIGMMPRYQKTLLLATTF
jgi:hypothetical protein